MAVITDGGVHFTCGVTSQSTETNSGVFATGLVSAKSLVTDASVVIASRVYTEGASTESSVGGAGTLTEARCDAVDANVTAEVSCALVSSGDESHRYTTWLACDASVSASLRGTGAKLDEVTTVGAIPVQSTRSVLC